MFCAIKRRRIFILLTASLALLLGSSPDLLAAPEKPRIRVDDYLVDADLATRAHRITAKARVKFTALDDISTAAFELHNALRPMRVVNAIGQVLTAERVTQDSSIRIALPAGMTKGESTTLTIEYEGVLSSADDSPVEGLKLASIHDDTTYLLYAARWFPIVGYLTNRFAATMNITVPTGMVVIGSGRATSKPAAPGKVTFSFVSDQPGFPGTIIAGKFDEVAATTSRNIKVFFKPNHREFAGVYGDTAEKEFEFFSSLYGPAPSPVLNVVEIPDDTVPAAWAPQIAALAAKNISDKTNYRLLANTIAHQWWGVSLSPASRNDFWLSDGCARYSEVRYVEQAAGQVGFEEATKDMSVGALAYDTIPLSNSGKLDPFSPEFQSLSTDKGGIILHMLRWVMGDANFDKTMKTFAAQFAGKSVTADDLRHIAEQAAGEKLTSFFAQWLDGTGAPEFKNKYTIYRVKNGFRIVGEISQDLDLFRMPLELKIDTDGKTEMKRIEVSGTNSPYTVETFGKPRHVSLDPNNWVLKNSGELKVRVAILRGQQLVAQGDLTEALREFQKALDVNKQSSLAHYRVAEVFFFQRNYQSAANAYREALNGDGEPKWTDVWSHVQLGKIFDTTGQRERATNEYRQALQTNDNTQGALDEARKYLNAPYQREKSKEGAN